MTVAGQRVGRGQPVPMDKLSDNTCRKLIEQNRVLPDKVKVSGPPKMIQPQGDR